MSELWRNNKTGAIYERLYEATDATNGERNGSIVTVYRSISGQVYVRLHEEFVQKFRPLDSENIEEPA